MNRELGELSQADIIILIELYKCNPCLWDSNHIHNKNTVWKTQVREKIGRELNISEADVRGKLGSLRGRWMKEHRRINLDGDYECQWPYYKYLKFLEGQYQLNSADTTTLSESSSTRERRVKRKMSYAPSWQDEMSDTQYNEAEVEIPIKSCNIKIERQQHCDSKYNEYEDSAKIKNENDKRKLDMKYIMSELEGLKDDDYYDIHYNILANIIDIKRKKRINKPGYP